MTSSVRHISEVDLANDEHIREVLGIALPNLIGQTLLGCLMADGREALVFPVVEDSPSVVSVAEAGEMVTALAGACVGLAEDPGVLIAWKRRGGQAPNDDDLAWLRAAPSACASVGVRLLGVWLVAGSAAPLRLDAPIS